MPEGAVTNPTNHSCMYTVDRHARIIVFSMTFFLGITGNTSLLLVIKKKSKVSTNDLFIINLAFADLTLLLFSLPLNLLIFEKINLPESFCRFVWPMMTVSNNVSIFTMCSMAVYRCRVIVYPLKPKIRRTVVLLWIMSLWVASFAVVVPLMVVAKSSTGGWCYEDWSSKKERQTYTACLAVIQYILPLMIITTAYIRIAFDLKFSLFSHLFKRRQTRYFPSSATRRKEDIHVIKTLAIIVILFAVFMLPGQIAWLLIDFGNSKYRKMAVILFKFYDLSVYFHCCLDPIIYGALVKHIRREIIRMLLKAFKFCSCCNEIARVNKKQSIDRDETIGHYYRRSSSQLAKEQSRVLLKLQNGDNIIVDTTLPHVNTKNEPAHNKKETVV